MRKRSKSGPIDQSTRVLRIRASEELSENMRAPSNGSGGGQIVARSREAWRMGEVARVEISLGPLVDEVILRGTVVDLRSGEDVDHPEVVVDIDPRHEERLAYVAAVLDRERPASARRFRRVPAELAVQWARLDDEDDDGSHSDRLADLSRGGAFITSSSAPSVGEQVDLELNLGTMRRPLHLRGVVAWCGETQRQTGFGVRFVVRDRDLAERLTDLVAEHDDANDIA